MPCIIEGCDKPHKAKGYCDTHYNYQRRRGKEWKPGVGEIMPMAQKFWPKVDVRGPDECWEWKACIAGATGYGLIGKGGLGAGSEGAHRISYKLNIGEIPHGKVVMHTCDNRKCVNPAHLRLGTKLENTHDMMRKGRHRFQAPRGERSSLAVLTEDKVRFIRDNPDISPTKMAEMMGVKYNTIWQIRSRKTWTHIP